MRYRENRIKCVRRFRLQQGKGQVDIQVDGHKDSDIKKQCETLYNELGINLTTAINVFLRQSLRAGGFPFEVRLEQPNKETIAAMLEAERIARDPSVKHYSDVEEALRELKK